MDLGDLKEVFSYHAPTKEQIASLQRIREAGMMLAEAILMHTPRCADQSAALRKVREAVMTANAAILLDGLG